MDLDRFSGKLVSLGAILSMKLPDGSYDPGPPIVARPPGFDVELLLDGKPLVQYLTSHSKTDKYVLLKRLRVPDKANYSIRVSVPKKSPAMVAEGSSFVVTISSGEDKSYVNSKLFSNEEAERFNLGFSHEFKGFWTVDEKAQEVLDPFVFDSTSAVIGHYEVNFFIVHNVKLPKRTEASDRLGNDRQVEAGQILALGCKMHRKQPAGVSFDWLETEVSHAEFHLQLELYDPETGLDFKVPDLTEEQTIADVRTAHKCNIEACDVHHLTLQDLRKLGRHLRKRCSAQSKEIHDLGTKIRHKDLDILQRDHTLKWIASAVDFATSLDGTESPDTNTVFDDRTEAEIFWDDIYNDPFTPLSYRQRMGPRPVGTPLEKAEIKISQLTEEVEKLKEDLKRKNRGFEEILDRVGSRDKSLCDILDPDYPARNGRALVSRRVGGASPEPSRPTPPAEPAVGQRSQPEDPGRRPPKRSLFDPLPVQYDDDPPTEPSSSLPQEPEARRLSSDEVRERFPPAPKAPSSIFGTIFSTLKSYLPSPPIRNLPTTESLVEEIATKNNADDYYKWKRGDHPHGEGLSYLEYLQACMETANQRTRDVLAWRRRIRVEDRKAMHDKWIEKGWPCQEEGCESCAALEKSEIDSLEENGAEKAEGCKESGGDGDEITDAGEDAVIPFKEREEKGWEDVPDS